MAHDTHNQYSLSDLSFNFTFGFAIVRVAPVEQWPHGSLRFNEFSMLDGGTRSTFHPDPM